MLIYSIADLWPGLRAAPIIMVIFASIQEVFETQKQIRKLNPRYVYNYIRDRTQLFFLCRY